MPLESLQDLPWQVDRLLIDNFKTEWSPEEDGAPSSIQSTLWSAILRTRDPGNPQRIAALIRLFSSFSMALYAYARVKLGNPKESETAVRGFLDFIRSARVGFGQREHRDRLRGFLLSAFEDYLGVQGLRGMEGSEAESQISFEAAEKWLRREKDFPSPESAFHRAWARCVLQQACVLLKDELAADWGSPAAELIATQISPLYQGPPSRDIAAILSVKADEALDMLRSARRRLRELLFDTIRETVSSTPDVEVEFWDLFKSVD